MATTTTAGTRLFNCQPGAMAPDWSGFRSLFIGGCISHDGQTEGGVPMDRAEFFTVYARDLEGLAEAITDAPEGATLKEAAEIGAELASLSGLPCELCPTLDPANHAGGSRAVVRMFGPGDLSEGQARERAEIGRAPCAVSPDPDAIPPADLGIVAGLCVLFLAGWGFVFGGGAAITAALSALFGAA